MAKYKVLQPSYIGGELITEQMISAAGDKGIIVEYAGDVRPDVDVHLELVDEPKNKADAKADTQKADAALRADAIAAKLTEDGSPGGKLIDDKTPMAVVTARLATFKQSNPFK